MFDGSKRGDALMQFDLGSIDTIGPLQPEFLIGLALSICVAMLAAKAAHAFWALFQDRTRRFVYGGIVALIIGVPVLLLPAPLVQWLYSFEHPNAYVCPFAVGYGYFVPILVYAYRLWAISKAAAKDLQPRLHPSTSGAVQ